MNSRKKPSPWKVFFSQSDEDASDVFHCTKCLDNKSVKSGGGTSNFKKHMASTHKEIYAETLKRLGEDLPPVKD